jgi:hypothetical protein
MPWCETCSRFLNPNTLREDGTCPTCGRPVADPPADAATGAGEGGGTAEERKKAPWHFKLLLAAVVVYLTWRFIQIGGWIVHWLTR